MKILEIIGFFLFSQIFTFMLGGVIYLTFCFVYLEWFKIELYMIRILIVVGIMFFLGLAEEVL